MGRRSHGWRPRSWRRTCGVASSLVLCCAALLLLSGLPSASATSRPGYRNCGSFQARYLVHVLARHVSCKKARRIQKEYWLAPESRKELVGPDSYNGYVRLKRFPGWRCTSGAMGGGCRKGRKEAAYSTYNPRPARAGSGAPPHQNRSHGVGGGRQ